jgi:phage gpG-like protein
MKITIQYDSAEVAKALNQIAAALGDLAPVLNSIGETLAASAKLRFKQGVGPDGVKWAPNRASTVSRYVASFSGSAHEDGLTLSRKGERLWDSKKPLIGESKALSSDIYADLFGGNELHVGSPMEYAAMQQFGGKKADYPHLWGDIPPRPFLGASEADERLILGELEDYFQASIR